MFSLSHLVAHIVTPTLLPGFVPWLAAAALWGGLLGAVAWRRRRRGVASAALAVAGLAATVLGFVDSATPPKPPGFTLMLASPVDGTAVSSPVLVVACGRWPDGSAAQVPGPGQLLLVLIDGVVASEGRLPNAAVDISPGRHSLRVEVITGNHAAYQPPVEVTSSVSVVAGAHRSTVALCPRS